MPYQPEKLRASVVQVIVALVAVIFETAAFEMTTAAEAATTLILNCLVAVNLAGVVES